MSHNFWQTKTRSLTQIRLLFNRSVLETPSCICCSKCFGGDNKRQTYLLSLSLYSWDRSGHRGYTQRRFVDIAPDIALSPSQGPNSVSSSNSCRRERQTCRRRRLEETTNEINSLLNRRYESNETKCQHHCTLQLLLHSGAPVGPLYRVSSTLFCSICVYNS